MFIFFENAQDNYDIEPMYFSEASSDSFTYIIKNELYPKIDAVLSTDQGKRNFNNIIGRYVSRNNDKLTTSGPQYLIPFTMKDKQEYFDLFSTSDTEVAALVDKITKQVNDKANWRLFKNNPIFFIFYCCIRYATLAKDAKLLNSALIAMALSVYPSIFAKYFRYEPNPNIMQFTIDNLSNRFIIKKSNHIFGTLTYSIQSSWKFHEKDFSRGADQDVIRFIQRIRNDQNSLLKKIANAYQTNYKKGLFVTTQVDAYDDNINVDNVNNTNKVEALSNKIVLSMLTNGVDLRIADFASNAAQVSKLDLRNYISLIINEKESETMKEFISSILFLYLYTDSHEPDEIRSKEFIGYALQLFKKTNSKDKNVTNIKTTLDKWGTSSGIYRKFSRSATRVDYTKAIFMYFILSIQMYS